MSRHVLPLARFRVPQARGWPRPRLHTALDEVGPGRPALVVAAAGCGKTTLLAHWARHRGGLVAWYRAETADAHLGLGPCLARALEVAGSPLALGAVTIAELVSTVEALGDGVTLVIDEVHELRGTPVVEELECLLLLAPPNLSVVLCGRVVPQLNFARSELSDPVRLTGEELRFRSWEVEELFRDFHREPLRPDDAAALAQRTHGWAAALQLFHLATKGRAPANRSRAIRTLATTARYAKEYLSAQVIDALPVPQQVLLRRTCVFDVVTPARCEALLPTGTAQADLDDLVARQALTTTDDGGASFRYHEVLRGYLEGELREELGEAAAKEWYRRAAAVLEEEGDVHGALRIRCRGGDWEGVRALLEGNGERLAAHRSAEWTALLPPNLGHDDPWVMLAIARRLLDEGSFEAAATTAREAQRHFGVRGGRQQCREIVRTASAWTGTPQLVSPTWADMLRAATQRNPQHWAERAERELTEPMASLVSGIAQVIAGDRRRALTTLHRVVGDTASPRADLAARLVLAADPLATGGIAAAAPALDGIAAEAHQQGALWLVRLCETMVRATTDAGAGAAVEAARQAAARGDFWGAIVLRLWLFECGLLTGRFDAADLDELIGACRALSAGALEAWPRAARALLAAIDGSADADVEARSAEAFARSAGVPGAQAIAYGALSIARGADGEELRELAFATGRSTGFELALIAPWASATPADPAPNQVVTSRAGSPPVEVHCFGPFRLRIDGVEQSLAGIRPRARSLLRLLALHAEQPVHRDRLTDLLWRDLDGEAATHNLHVALSSLRRALPDTEDARVVIERTGEAYRLVLGEYARSDVADFSAAVHEAQQAAVRGDATGQLAALRHALERYTGDLLPEEGGAEWVLAAREQYQLLAVGAAADLAELELAAGSPAAAVATTRRGLRIDRYDDRCWRLLLAAHRAQGDVAAAGQAEREYHAVLDTLGVAVDRQSRGQPLARNSSSPSGASGPLAGR